MDLPTAPWSRVGCARRLSRGVAPALVALLLLLGASSAEAAPGDPYMVRDINPSAGSDPILPIIESGGLLFFSADDGVHGRELWRSDGTREGTWILRDINEGSADGVFEFFWELIDVGGTIFFAADPGSGQQLWKSDGTPEGTVMVADIAPSRLAKFQGDLYFSADGGLWRSDGSAAGTVPVKEFGGGSIFSIVDVDGTLFFAQVIRGGFNLWRSDGTGAGTQEVASGVAMLSGVDLGGQLLFANFASGGELWISDGTGAGTVEVTDISPTAGFLTRVGGKVFFPADNGVAGDELWVTDGTEAGTEIVADINPGPGDSRPNGFGGLGGVLFFDADDGGGFEPWRSDGTEAGTTMVKDINTGGPTNAEGPPTPNGLRVIGDTLFYSADDGVNGAELWKSDGTGPGTVPVGDINPGSGDSNPVGFIGLGDNVFFRADDGTGIEFWALDEVPPSLEITSGPDGRTADARPIFTFLGDQEDGFGCRIFPQGRVPAPPFGSCSDSGSHASPGPLEDGSWTFQVTVRDAGQNRTTANRSFRVTAGACEVAQEAKAGAKARLDKRRAAKRKAQERLRRARRSGSRAEVREAEEKLNKANSRRHRAKAKLVAARTAVARNCV